MKENESFSRPLTDEKILKQKKGNLVSFFQKIPNIVIPKNWLEKITFTDKTDFQALQDFLFQEYKQGKKILPEKKLIFNSLIQTPLTKVKVVILGQDPYPNKIHAHGLAFSIPKETKDIPKSLKNIMQELKNDLGIEKKNGNLINWAKQGVLLLNRVLTVREKEPNSHKSKGWEKLTREIIQIVNKERKNVVFLLWGNSAKKLKKEIDESKHLILVTPHPSPLSAYRGFFNSKIFSKTNKYLVENGLTPINWE